MVEKSQTGFPQSLCLITVIYTYTFWGLKNIFFKISKFETKLHIKFMQVTKVHTNYKRKKIRQSSLFHIQNVFINRINFQYKKYTHITTGLTDKQCTCPSPHVKHNCWNLTCLYTSENVCGRLTEIHNLNVDIFSKCPQQTNSNAPRVL